MGGAGGTEFVIRPMLARPVPLDTLDRYVHDDLFVAQQKVDGDRLMVAVRDGVVRALNRNGELYRNPVPGRVLRQFERIKGQWCFDGELLDGELWLFDLPAATDLVTPKCEYSFRVDVLERFFSMWRPDGCVRLLPAARTRWAKASLVDRVLSSNHEGVVLRRVDGLYVSGPRRSWQMLKAKVEKTVDCVVAGVHVDGKNNCSLRLFEDGQPVDVGTVAMFGKPNVGVGDVVEIKYLYADTRRKLVQAAFLRVRDDKTPEECTIDQLVFTDRSVISRGGLIRVPTRKRVEPGQGLGRTQQTVLQLLAFGQKSVRTLASDGFGLSESSVYGALQRLGLRGLVDREYVSSDRENQYFLTRAGAEVEAALTGVDDEEDA